MNFISSLVVVLAATALPSIGQTWTPISMPTKIEVPGSTFRTTEPNPSGPFTYTISGTSPWVNDSSCDLSAITPYVYVSGVRQTGLISRGPQRGNVSAQEWIVRGLQLYALFGSSGAFEEAAFFHESPCYIGGIEFGFARNANNGQLSFYWADNANCFPTGAPDGQCYTSTSGPSGQLVSTRRDILLPALGVNSGLSDASYYYGAYMSYESGRWYWRIVIQDPFTFATVWDNGGAPVDPGDSNLATNGGPQTNNSNWFQSEINFLYHYGGGYVTTVLQGGPNTGGNFQIYQSGGSSGVKVAK